MSTTRGRKVHTYEHSVWARWGRDSRREIAVPYVYGPHSHGRYYVLLATTGESLGWVCKIGSQWHGMVPQKVTKGSLGDDFRGDHVVTSRSRQEAAEAVIAENTRHHHASPVYDLVEAAYAEGGAQ